MLTEGFSTHPRAARVRIEVDGVRLHHIDWGEGAPVLFVHGWAFSSPVWARQMYDLSRAGRRCIAFDRRGHGRSEDPGCGYDFDTLADDLAEVIEQLGLTGVTLVGHSMGCGEIVRYLTRCGPGRVDRIVLVGSSTPYMARSDDNPTGVEPAMLEALRGQLATDFPKWLRDNGRPFVAPATSTETVDWLVNLAQQTSFKAMMDCNLQSLTTDFRPELAKLDIPALVIHGDRDVSAPLDLTGRPTARLIAGARLKVYEGAAHGLMLTHAERLNTDLAAFIDDGEVREAA